jgi:hypothetical protein
MHATCDVSPTQLSLEVPFTTYQVAVSVGDVLSKLEPAPRSILLIGVAAELLVPLLPEHDLTDHKVDDTSADEPLPFADGEFDCVLCVDTLDLLPNPVRRGFVAELRRVTSAHVMVVGPFASDVISSAEESLNEIHKAASGQAHPIVRKHLEEGLPDLKAIRDALAFPKAGLPVAIPHTSLRTWALLHMVASVADASDRTRVMFTKLNAFYNQRLARIDHAAPAYRHLLLASADASGLPKALVRDLRARFSSNAREDEMETVRGLLRIALDSYAEALAVPPPKGVLAQAIQRVEELERKVRSQARTIDKLHNELYIRKSSAETKKPVRLLKKLFTF